MGGYGTMTVNNQATSQAGFTSTPSKLANLGATIRYNGVTVDGADNKIIVKIQGLYLVLAQVTFQKETTDDQDNFNIFLYRNGVSTGLGFARNLKAGEHDLGSGSLHGVLELEKSDVLELYLFTDAAGPSTVTVVDAQFSIVGV